MTGPRPLPRLLPPHLPKVEVLKLPVTGQSQIDDELEDE